MEVNNGIAVRNWTTTNLVGQIFRDRQKIIKYSTPKDNSSVYLKLWIKSRNPNPRADSPTLSKEFSCLIITCNEIKIIVVCVGVHFAVMILQSRVYVINSYQWEEANVSRKRKQNREQFIESKRKRDSRWRKNPMFIMNVWRCAVIKCVLSTRCAVYLILILITVNWNELPLCLTFLLQSLRNMVSNE